jgi:hypothetical protein
MDLKFSSCVYVPEQYQIFHCLQYDIGVNDAYRVLIISI